LSRLNDKSEGRIVIQQRLHEDDPVGYLLESGQFEHLNLPALAEADNENTIGSVQVARRRRGEALCPERELVETLERLSREIGPTAFSAQYQQDRHAPWR